MTRDEQGAVAALWRAADVLRFSVKGADSHLGHVRDCCFDDQSWIVRDLVVDAGRWLSHPEVFVDADAVCEIDIWHEEFVTALPRSAMQAGGDARAARESDASGHPRRTFGELCKQRIVAVDGDLGRVDDVLVEEGTWAIRYLVIDPRTWWVDHHLLLSTQWIARLDWSAGIVVADVHRETAMHAPGYLPSAPIAREYEVRLHAHYGRRGYWECPPDAAGLGPAA